MLDKQEQPNKNTTYVIQRFWIGKWEDDFITDNNEEAVNKWRDSYSNLKDARYRFIERSYKTVFSNRLAYDLMRSNYA